MKKATFILVFLLISINAFSGDYSLLGEWSATAQFTVNRILNIEHFFTTYFTFAFYKDGTGYYTWKINPEDEEPGYRPFSWITLPKSKEEVECYELHTPYSTDFLLYNVDNNGFIFKFHPDGNEEFIFLGIILPDH